MSAINSTYMYADVFKELIFFPISIYLFIYFLIYLFIYLFIYFFICLCVSIYLFMYHSFISFNLFHQNWTLSYDYVTNIHMKYGTAVSG